MRIFALCGLTALECFEVALLIAPQHPREALGVNAHELGASIGLLF